MYEYRQCSLYRMISITINIAIATIAFVAFDEA